MKWVLASDEGKEYELNGSGEIVVNGDVTGFTLKKAPEIPLTYSISQNYPNPFNPVTTLKYDLPEQSMVVMTVYDLMGREVTILVNQVQKAGYHTIRWNGTDQSGQVVSAGLYIYRITANDFTSTKKMLLLK